MKKETVVYNEPTTILVLPCLFDELTTYKHKIINCFGNLHDYDDETDMSVIHNGNELTDCFPEMADIMFIEIEDNTDFNNIEDIISYTDAMIFKDFVGSIDVVNPNYVQGADNYDNNELEMHINGTFAEFEHELGDTLTLV